jgi:hypothetical protein
MDFTLKRYIEFLDSLSGRVHTVRLCSDIKATNIGDTFSLRYDVDTLPMNSLLFARAQSERGIRGSFYFRIVPTSFSEKIIDEICSLGHEIGYHYEDMDLSFKRFRVFGGDLKVKRISERDLAEIAIESFSKNLSRLRRIAPINTICMHGSPLSRWDNRILWKYYDYKQFGIDLEPYFDIDFSNRLYLTDTGRKWNGASVIVRDKVTEFGIEKANIYTAWKSKPVKGSLMWKTPESIEFREKHRYRSTVEIIKAIKNDTFPNNVMMTFHPQRWADSPTHYLKELAWQNIKNVGKFFLAKKMMKLGL